MMFNSLIIMLYVTFKWCYVVPYVCYYDYKHRRDRLPNKTFCCSMLVPILKYVVLFFVYRCMFCFLCFVWLLCQCMFLSENEINEKWNLEDYNGQLDLTAFAIRQSNPSFMLKTQWREDWGILMASIRVTFIYTLYAPTLSNPLCWFYHSSYMAYPIDQRLLESWRPFYFKHLTPHLSRLAKESKRGEYCYANGPNIKHHSKL